jgi:pyrroloquinoline-quinone synthase
LESTYKPNEEDLVSSSLWDRIEQARAKWNVLEHPFYTRWTAGELSRDELADYSGQYRHATQAIATLAGDIRDRLPERTELRSHALEEEAHVELWDGFVDAVGGDRAARPNPQTAGCVDAWTASEGTLAALGRLYAIESGQPEISRVKRDGLVKLYGVEDGPGTAYFRVHEGRDAEHAAESRELISELAGPGDEDVVVAAAESAFRANWGLLDGVTAAA